MRAGLFGTPREVDGSGPSPIGGSAWDRQTDVRHADRSDAPHAHVFWTHGHADALAFVPAVDGAQVCQNDLPNIQSQGRLVVVADEQQRIDTTVQAIRTACADRRFDVTLFGAYRDLAANRPP